MKKCIIAVLAVLCSITGHALDVAVTPGSLAAAVGGCIDAEELIIEGNLNSKDFIFIENNMQGIKKLDLSQATFDVIPDAVFAGSRIEKVIFPSGCHIGCLAFSGSAINSLELPSGCIVGDGAFAACPHLNDVHILGEVKLGNNVFCDNTSLTIVEGGENIKVIKDRAFDGCILLEKFDYSPSLRVVGYRAFADTGLKEANLEQCIELDSIAPWAFSECPLLASATLPNNHGEGIFFGCNALEKIDISSNNIEDFALTNTAKLKRMVFPSNLSYAGNSSMEGMSSLQEIDARALTSVPVLGKDVWARFDQEKVILHVAPLLADAFASTPQWSDFNILAEQTDASLILAYENIKVWFTSTELIAESAVSDLKSLAVIDIEGRTRLHTAASGQRASVDASSLPAAVYIVEITLADGSRHVAKLKKNG